VKIEVNNQVLQYLLNIIQHYNRKKKDNKFLFSRTSS